MEKYYFVEHLQIMLMNQQRTQICILIKYEWIKNKRCTINPQNKNDIYIYILI